MTTPQDDHDAYRLRLEAKLSPQRIRATLAFAALVQMTHELIKQAVLDRVAGFHGRVELLDRTPEGRPTYEWISAKEEYDKRVLSLVPRNAFKASLRWLVDQRALNGAQADRLAAFFSHRHDLTHELLKFIVDPDVEPEVELLSDALSILGDIHRFWSSIEKDMGSFDHLGDVDLDQVAPASLLVLQMCLDAYVEGLED